MVKLKHIVAIILTAFTALVLLLGYYHDDTQPTAAVSTYRYPNASFAQVSLADARAIWEDLTNSATEAFKISEKEVSETDFILARECAARLPAGLQNALGEANFTAVLAWLYDISAEGLREALGQWQAIDRDALPEEVIQYIEDHPVDVALYVVETLLILMPGGLYIPVLRALGFTRTGVRLRSIAAFIQSKIGARVPGRGWFAHLVSGMMGGYGKKVLKMWMRVGLKIGTWIDLLRGRQGQ